MSGKQATTSPQFPKFAKQSMRKINQFASDLYDDPSTSMIPDLNPFTQQGIGQRAEIAGGGNSIANPGLDEARRILGGEYLDLSNNPSWQRNMGEAMGAASDRFAGSGRVGSGSYAGALGDAATGVTAQMFNTERNRQTDVLSMLPQLVSGQYADSAALEDAGRALDEDAMARFDWPYARLDRFANTVYGSPATQIPGQKSSSPFDWLSAVGGMLTPKI